MLPPDTSEAKLRAHLEGLLAQAARVECLVRGNAGVGQLFEFRAGSSRGAKLHYEGRAIHTAIL